MFGTNFVFKIIIRDQMHKIYNSIVVFVDFRKSYDSADMKIIV